MLSIVGTLDRFYEVVILKKGDFSALSQGDMVPWLLFDSSDSEYLKIKDSMVSRFTRINYYKIGVSNDSEDFIYNRKPVDLDYYTDFSKVDTTDISKNYNFQYSIERIDLDTLLIVEKGRRSRNNNDQINVIYRKTSKKIVKRESFPSFRTDEELTDLFKATQKGFYSDSLYQTLDPNDPMDYVRVFIEDGKRYGVYLTHILNQAPTSLLMGLVPMELVLGQVMVVVPNIFGLNMMHHIGKVAFRIHFTPPVYK